MSTKRCTTCKDVKPVSEFYKNRARYDGLDNRCKKCANERRGKRRDKVARTPAGRRARYGYNIKARYGVTIDEYDLMFKCQNGVCAICGQPEPRHYNKVRMRLAIDHDHETGAVRQLLCSKCNFVVGLVDEDPDILTKTVEYLNKHKGEQ